MYEGEIRPGGFERLSIDREPGKADGQAPAI
jgi:hypothetical protein